MALTTQLTEIPYPSEKEDPFFDSFESMVKDIDSKIYGLLSSACNVVIAPNIVWNASSSLLTWDDDFVVQILSTNRKLLVRYGPDTLSRSATVNDGDKLIIVVPNSSDVNVVANLQIVPANIPWQTGLFILGMRYVNGLYMNISTRF